MTSSAISLLSTVSTQVPQASAADQAGPSVKNDAKSFSETLQKAGQAKHDKMSNNSSHDAKANKHSAATPIKASTQADKPSTPGAADSSALTANQGKDASKVEQDTEISQAPPATSTKESPLLQEDLSTQATKPVKDEDSADPLADVVIPAAVIAPAVPNAATMIAQQAQVQPHPQIAQEQVADKISDNTLGSSILASISMGKSLDKSATGEKTLAPVAAKIKAELLSTAKAESPALAGADTSKLAALTAADASSAAKTPAQATQPAIEDVAIKTTPDKFGEGKPADVKPSIDGVSSLSSTSATAIPQASVTQGASSSAATATLQTPVSNPEWAKNLGQQLVNFHLKGDQNVQLHLNPSNLGPMSITLNVNEHLQATAHFASHSGQVRSALEQGIGQLREAMAQQGISLGETSVGEQRQQGFAQSDQGNSQRGNIKQLPGMSVVADEPSPVQAASAAGAGEISTYA